jgi:hypothetical protein
VRGRPNTAEPREPYKTDLTDAQWDIIRDLIPPAIPKPGCQDALKGIVGLTPRVRAPASRGA